MITTTYGQNGAYVSESEIAGRGPVGAIAVVQRGRWSVDANQLLTHDVVTDARALDGNTETDALAKASAALIDAMGEGRPAASEVLRLDARRLTLRPADGHRPAGDRLRPQMSYRRTARSWVGIARSSRRFTTRLANASANNGPSSRRTLNGGGPPRAAAAAARASNHARLSARRSRTSLDREARVAQQALQRRAVDQEAGRAVGGPGCRVADRAARTLQDVEQHEGGARPQHARDLTVEPGLVRDVHRRVLGIGGGEAAVRERQVAARRRSRTAPGRPGRSGGSARWRPSTYSGVRSTPTTR